MGLFSASFRRLPTRRDATAKDPPAKNSFLLEEKKNDDGDERRG